MDVHRGTDQADCLQETSSSGGQDSEDANDDAHGHLSCSGTDPEVREYMTCAACHCLIMCAADVIEERAETWKDAVYAYTLSVCDRDCWCYSATNPGDVRFDVVRVLPNCEGVELSSPPTPAHSWFPGYAWRRAHCKMCRAHLGWGFCAPNEDNSGEPSSDNPHEQVGPDGIDASQGNASCHRDSGQDTVATGRLIPRSHEVCNRPGAIWQKESAFNGLILTKLRPASLTRDQVEELRAAHWQRELPDPLQVRLRQQASSLLAQIIRPFGLGLSEADEWQTFQRLVQQLAEVSPASVVDTPDGGGDARDTTTTIEEPSNVRPV